MRRTVALLFVLVFVKSSFAADPRWVHVPSTDFEIFSTASEGDTKRTLDYFEATSSFFTQSMGYSPAKTEPFQIVIFGSKKEYEPYRLNEFAIAYYAQRNGRDYIVMGNSAADALPVAVHEYVHLVVRHLGRQYPPWLNEGLAEVYSTMKPLGGKMLVGVPPLGRYQALTREKWVPLQTILAADHNSPYYNEKDKAGNLYNEGWALVHMLLLTNQYRQNFSKVEAAIQGGTPSQQALEQTYGKPLAAIENELQSYIRRGEFNGVTLPLAQKKTEKATVEPASSFDVKLTLTGLGDKQGKEAETRKNLEELIGENSKRPEPYAALGYLNWRTKDVDAARKSFAKALELGSRNPDLLWDYGRIGTTADAAGSIRALNLLLEQQPDRIEVRLALAQTQLNGEKVADALETLKPVKRVSAKDAPKLFQLWAYAHLRAGDQEAARADAKRWQENAADETERERAQQLLTFLDRREGPAPVAAGGFDTSDIDDANNPQPPGERASGAPLTQLVATTNAPWSAGTFLDFDCSGPQPKVILSSNGQKSAFVLDKPDEVRVFGNTATLNLTCGLQAPKAIWVEYLPVQDQPGISGLLRTIHYEPRPAP